MFSAYPRVRPDPPGANRANLTHGHRSPFLLAAPRLRIWLEATASSTISPLIIPCQKGEMPERLQNAVDERRR